MAESQNIEWKESWRDEYLKWVCGFANAQGAKFISAATIQEKSLVCQTAKNY
ncbi:MAG: ATP-binding protein [Lachnospiraceae bacterium]|nr:ATP-binding protein [Lachnospiraceae bacterium]